MDGNRRWARRHDRTPEYGHTEGVEAARKVIEFCLARQIRYVSLYTFSLENNKRSMTEKQHLFHLIVAHCAQSIDDFIKNGIRVLFIGDRTQFPEQVLQACQEIEAATSHCTTLTVASLFFYGGQQEIVAATNTIIEAVQQGVIRGPITMSEFTSYLWSALLPPPDLIIRTGGYKRISNFLLYHAAYSELCFLDCLWPELTKEHLEQICEQFEQEQRNFGI
jgi:undecaprenyl diphosphate synthase